MRLNTAVQKLREHVGKSTADLGKDLEVSHTTIVNWEAGAGIGKFNRLVLLGYAKRVEAPADVIAAFEKGKPEISAEVEAPKP